MDIIQVFNSLATYCDTLKFFFKYLKYYPDGILADGIPSYAKKKSGFQCAFLPSYRF